MTGSDFVTWRELAQHVPSKETVERLDRTVTDLSERINNDNKFRTTAFLLALTNAIALVGLFTQLKH